MFDQLFVLPKALARHQSGPLVEERRAYLTYLAQQQMAHSGLRIVAAYLLVIAHSLRLAERPGEGITPGEIEQQATRWANRPNKRIAIQSSPRARERFIGFATTWLRFLGWFKQPPPPICPYADSITAFADHLQRDQGLSLETVNRHCQYLQDFLRRLGDSPQILPQITLPQIEKALIEKFANAGYARSTIGHYAQALRAFFRYAQRQGWCCSGLANGIELPRFYRQATLPIGPSWEDVQRLLAQAQSDHPTDIRDRALLVLLAIYGFRAGEVVCLRLDDFDWEHEILTVVRPKRLTTQTYPLCRTVGDAVLRYLREVRPCSVRREVFLLCRAPFRPLSTGGLGTMVRRRLHALGVSLPYCGPHALRHACATHLLKQGLSLKEIGTHLGHQHPDSTRIYAKVDLPQLRRVAEFDLGGLR